ncbi:MAG: CbtB domain-containing protein [Pseudomonadota bacterium]|nr:CbtB domain-containing protein [Pseudomonadota bacterium]
MSPNHVATDARSNEFTAVVLGLLFSAFLILGVGFFDSSTIHKAANDTRHTVSFPCH